MEQTPWVSEQEASSRLGVSKKTLEFWREIGYLKPGTHWRSSSERQQKPWNPKVIYHLRWCKEIIEYWKEHDVPLSRIAA
tara:strand:+ start:3247 stop:3486 length:240 start_codon:yes stop_codon:yes gene_type:complete